MITQYAAKLTWAGTCYVHVSRYLSEMRLNVSRLQLPDDAVFIRGYNTTFNFSFELINTESALNIDAALPGSLNYDVTVTTASPAAARRRRDVSADPTTSVTQSVEISDDQLAQNLGRGSQINITGEVCSVARKYSQFQSIQIVL